MTAPGFPRIGKGTRLFFQGLESFAADFSKPWKKRTKIFQALEKTAIKFPSLGKPAVTLDFAARLEILGAT